MDIRDKFIAAVKNSYTFKGETILIGSAVLGDDQDTGCQITLPLKTMNRHGLIAGATGTGKTKSLQVLAENLSKHGVPVLLMDVKGDLSGIAAPGSMNPVIEKRAGTIGIDWKPSASPAELMTISDEPGIKLKATVSEFGPILLGKILDLNENQTGILSMIFKFCDDKNLPLLDIKDLKAVLKYIQEDGKDEFQKDYGYFQGASAGTIMRMVTGLEQEGADKFFGEPSFDIFDLMRTDSKGNGMINIFRVTDIQSNTALFSTFMLCLLAEIFQKFPEKGDVDKPELVIFFDEAHLIFNNATKTLLDHFETTIKLIRSKGVGIILVTQSPDDIPASILGQLGMKIQHALRAFTAKDRQAIKLAAQNYPITGFYKTDELITQMGIGEALVTALNEKGMPTELVHTLMCPPCSRMDILTQSEMDEIVRRSDLVDKYNRDIDRESAFEILSDKMAEQEENERRQKERMEQERYSSRPSYSGRRQTSTFEQIMKSPITRTVAREVTRGLLGVLGFKRR
jgi:uncharacterized protein